MKIIKYINKAKLIEENNKYYILKPKKINDGDSFDQIISNNSINNILENVYYYT